MKNKTKFWYFENFDLFSKLNPGMMDKMMKITSMRSTDSKEIIYFPEQPSSNIFFVKEGKVKLSRISDDGREFTLAVLGPGELFGEMAAFGESQRDDMAIALEPTLICAIDTADFQALIIDYPEMILRITKRIGLRRKKIEQFLESLVFKDANQRIATFLLNYQEEFGQDRAVGRYVKPFLSHEEIGFLTATSRQTANKILNDLRAEGIIDFTRNTLTILDLTRLQAKI